MTDKDPSRQAPDEVDAYLGALTEGDRTALQRVREIIHEVAPDCTERVSYRSAMFRLRRDLVALSAHAHYVALPTLSPALAETIHAEFPQVALSGATIRFTPETPLPREVIEQLVRARMVDAA